MKRKLNLPIVKFYEFLEVFKTFNSMTIFSQIQYSEIFVIHDLPFLNHCKSDVQTHSFLLVLIVLLSKPFKKTKRPKKHLKKPQQRKKNFSQQDRRYNNTIAVVFLYFLI